MARGDVDVVEVRRRAQEAICAVLIDKIREDPYPSTTMMDLVEQHIPQEQLAEYIDVLLDKIDGERFPSMDMIRRITALS